MIERASNASIQAEFFEELHRGAEEPFSYSTRAVERLRHEWIVGQVARVASGVVLDLGCSRGQLTAMLAELPIALVAVDVAPCALIAASERVPQHGARFAAGNALALPVASGQVDVVVAADGIYSWNLEALDRDRCLSEIHRVLAPSGRVLFTEHTRPFRFSEFIQQIARNGFEIEWVEYLYDRPWYQVESWFKMLQGTGWVRAARDSGWLARRLRRIGRLLGPAASRHVCVLARKATVAKRRVPM
jgi:ubiquinone/menaquinone biosynthesis C-methylase UbiE